MLDLHTHTVFSDGALIPAELARRAQAAGYNGVALTDHADSSNMGWILENQLEGVRRMGPYLGVDVFVGIELTHVPPPLIPDLVEKARGYGAALVVVHGETLAEPVPEGTNLEAIEAGADILAHPGLISREEAELAADRGVVLEISTRKGHCLSNGHVAQMARQCGAHLIINNDAHAPGDFLSKEQRVRIAEGAGLHESEILQAERCSRRLADGMHLAGQGTEDKG